jgi:hypothetical protein
MLGVGACALVAAFQWSCGSICRTPECDGDTAYICLAGEDPDGPNTYTLKFVCPDTTACEMAPGGTEGTNPACFISPAVSCTGTEQQCVGNVPSYCKKRSDGTFAFAAMQACDADQVCVEGASFPLCVLTAMTPCPSAGATGCVNGGPSLCVRLASGDLVWEYDHSPCASGTQCVVFEEDGAQCVPSPLQQCGQGAAPVCIGDYDALYCEKLTDGSRILVDETCDSTCEPLKAGGIDCDAHYIASRRAPRFSDSAR